MRIELLNAKREAEYEAFLGAQQTALLYYSAAYRQFLSRLLTDAESHYFLAYDANQLVGVLPCYVKNSRHGSVLNSLPFYGSHGGVVSANWLPQSESNRVKEDLLAAYVDLERRCGAVASTLVSNPLCNDDEFYAERVQARYRDERIGQFTSLSGMSALTAELPEALMRRFHVKTRNMVRKAQKSGFSTGTSGSAEDLRQLCKIHQENLAVLGGQAKSWEVFDALSKTFTYGRDYELYVARKNDQVSSALLILFYGKVAEYFVPATRAQYRQEQPLSLLIFEAFQDAVRRGCRVWNWGGTWLTQSGVYHFKSRWGATDKHYHYYTRINDESVCDRTRDELLSEYPSFYVIPFAHLRTKNNIGRG